MAITKSARKAIRQNAKRKEGNIIYKDKMRGLIKTARALVLEKKVDEAKKLLPQIYQILDKAAKVGVIKKNTSSKTKSRLALLINKNSAK